MKEILQKLKEHLINCKKIRDDTWNNPKNKGRYDPYWHGVVDGLEAIFNALEEKGEIHFSLVEPSLILNLEPKPGLWGRQPREHEKYVTTTDWWCGNFIGDKVYVAIGELTPWKPDQKVQWRTMVWGTDDMGLEKDVDTFEEAKRLYDMIEDGVDFEYLTELGFYHA